MTELLVASVGATGLLLFLSGLPLRGPSLAHRVDPYVSGRHGTSSSGGVGRGWRAAVIRPLGRSRSVDRSLRDRLDAAGLVMSADSFRLEQLSWAVMAALGTTACAFVAYALGASIEPTAIPPLVLISLLSGFLGRDWWLSRQVAARQAALRDELPAAIDLITLSIMAGESIPAACARVAAILPTGIGAEFHRVVADVRAGTPVVDALEGFARRVPEVGVGRFVDAVITGIEKGAPLADTLRAQADDGREARRRYLLEVGGRREVLMLVPVVFLVMPVVVVFALYPGLVTLELLVP